MRAKAVADRSGDRGHARRGQARQRRRSRTRPSPMGTCGSRSRRRRGLEAGRARRRPSARSRPGALPWAVVPPTGAVWVSNANAGTVTRIDPETDRHGQLRGRPPTARPRQSAKGRVWVSLGLSAGDAPLEDRRQARAHGRRGRRSDRRRPTRRLRASPRKLALGHATGARLMDYRVRPRGAATIVPEVAAGPTDRVGGRAHVHVHGAAGIRVLAPVDRGGDGGDLPRLDRARAEAETTIATTSSASSGRSTAARRTAITFMLKTPTGDLSARVAHPCAARRARRCARIVKGRHRPAAAERGAVLPRLPRVRAADRAASGTRTTAARGRRSSTRSSSRSATRRTRLRRRSSGATPTS